MPIHLRFRRGLAAAAGVLAVVAFTACGSDDGSEVATAGTSKAEKKLKIAYLSFAVANSYDAPMLAAAKASAASQNAKITVFDANNDPNKQLTQMQDVIARGGYDAIIVQPIFGTGLISAVGQAIKQGIKVVNLDQIMGKDLGTAKVQVPGLSGNVVFIPSLYHGTKAGKLMVDLCAKKGANPCKVGYIHDAKASALDGSRFKAFEAAIKGSPVDVVAEGDAVFSIEGGLKATQDMLAGHPDLDAIIGSDQSIQGAEQALGKKKAILIGTGGSAIGMQRVAAGKWDATIATLPATEGRMAVEAAVKAARTGTDTPGQDPVSKLPAEAIVTKENYEKFDAEWPG